MSAFSKPFFAIFLIILFMLAGVAGGRANGLEIALMRQLATIRANWPQVTQAIAAFTALGGAHVTLALAGLASLWLLLRRAPGHALLLAVTVLGERALVEGLKDLIGRTRPPLDAHLLPHSLAFPSGHSANSMTAFLTTAFIAAPPAYRRPAAIFALGLSICIGLSRIYLGVHWPSDVVGGWALGLLAVCAALALGRRSDALRLEEQHEVVGRHRLALDEDEAA